MLKPKTKQMIHEIVDHGFYAKGHQSGDDFAALLRAADIEDPEAYAGFAVHHFYHGYLRCNPDPSGEYRVLICDGVPGRRGTFKATILDFDRGSSFYAYMPYEKDTTNALERTKPC